MRRPVTSILQYKMHVKRNAREKLLRISSLRKVPRPCKNDLHALFRSCNTQKLFWNYASDFLSFVTSMISGLSFLLISKRKLRRRVVRTKGWERRRERKSEWVKRVRDSNSLLPAVFLRSSWGRGTRSQFYVTTERGPILIPAINKRLFPARFYLLSSSLSICPSEKHIALCTLLPSRFSLRILQRPIKLLDSSGYILDLYRAN